MRRSLLVLSVLGVAALAVRWRHHATPENKAALAVEILKDVAETDGDGISWRTHGDAAAATLWQHERVEFRGGLLNASVDTNSWHLELFPSKVFSVTCYVTGGDHGYPEYGFISFQPEDGDVFDALFDVGFDGSRIDALERLCAKHGIPVER
jgi:hypothetical protein